MSKNTFLKVIVEEIKRVEESLWGLLKNGQKEEIPHKIDYMQELILQLLRILNEVEVEILLFKVEKTELGNKVEKDLEDLYVILEKQKEQLNEISLMNNEEIVKILDGANSDKVGFSESSERVSEILKDLSLEV